MAYQGYDDARAALMDVIAQALVKYGEATKTVYKGHRVVWPCGLATFCRPYC